MTFIRYQSRPITRLAHEITEKDRINTVNAKHLRLTTHEGQVITFAHHQPVNTGDFVVYQDDAEIYHCRRAVFIERNIVPGERDAEESEA